LQVEPEHWQDEEHSRLQLEALGLLLREALSGSPVLISFLTEMLNAAADGGVRSRLQIELILRSLNPS